MPEVVDTGMGIPAAELPHLFERSFRSEGARAAAVPGSGLGPARPADGGGPVGSSR